MITFEHSEWFCIKTSPSPNNVCTRFPRFLWPICPQAVRALQSSPGIFWTTVGVPLPVSVWPRQGEKTPSVWRRRWQQLPLKSWPLFSLKIPRDFSWHKFQFSAQYGNRNIIYSLLKLGNFILIFIKEGIFLKLFHLLFAQDLRC